MLLIPFLIVPGLFVVSLGRAALPFVLMIGPALLLLRSLPAERWEKAAFLPLYLFMAASTLSFGLSLWDAFHKTTVVWVALIVNGVSAFSLRHLFTGSLPARATPPRAAMVGTLSITVVLAAIFFYGRVFDVPNYSNGPYPAFAQMGLNIARTGSFHLITPAEAAYDTTGFHYTSAYPGFLAWSAAWVPFSRLGAVIGVLAPLLIGGFCTIFLAAAWRSKWRIENALLALLLVFPSYAIFRIAFEIDSDNAAFALSAAVLYLFVRLNDNPTPFVQRRLLGHLLLLWGFSFWIRLHLALLLAATMAVMVLWAPFRAAFATYFSPGPEVWSRPFRLGLIGLVLFLGPIWEVTLWINTGSPIPPRSLPPFAIRADFEDYAAPKSGSNMVAEPAPSDGHPAGLLQELAYDFFPFSTDGGPVKALAKSVRAFVHGNTFSGLFSVLLALGVFMALRNLRTGASGAEAVSLCFLLALVALITKAGYYYKLFYGAVPFFLAFVVTALQRLGGRRSAGVVPVASAAFAIIFLASFLFAGVGTWAPDRRWAILKAPLRSADGREWVKNGETLEPAITYLRSLPANENVLYFHPEPGHSLAYLVDHHPFWEDYHYDSRRLAGLHRVETPEALLRALKALKIRHVVVSKGMTGYETSGEPDWLPRLIATEDPRLELVAASSGGVHRVFRVRP